MKKITVLFGLFVASFILSGCPASKVACQIIKTANEACAVIEMVGVDGKPVQVPVTNEELQGFGKMASSRREAEKKAGVSMGAPLPSDAGTGPLKPDQK